MLTLRRPHETVDECAPVDPMAWSRSAALTAEGFGYDSPFARTPHEAVDALAAPAGRGVEADDLGRRSVSRKTARRLFAEQAAAERRQREVQERRDAKFAELAAANPVWAGIPAPSDWDGVSAETVMLQAAKDAQPRRRSVLEHALAGRDGQAEYIPICPVPE
jgi:hypothetical protein